MSKNTKLFALILLATTILGLLLFRELRKASSITTKATDVPLVADVAIPINIAESDPVLGNPGAPVTAVEYLDLKDKQSKKIHEEIVNYVRKNPQEVRLILKHAPLSGWFSTGVLAHEAAYCAGKQGKMWDFLDAVINNDLNLRESGLRTAAGQVKLDVSKWWTCTNSEGAKRAVQAGMDEERTLSAGKPPLVYLNNRMVNLKEDVSITELLQTVTAK